MLGILVATAHVSGHAVRHPNSCLALFSEQAVVVVRGLELLVRRSRVHARGPETWLDGSCLQARRDVDSVVDLTPHVLGLGPEMCSVAQALVHARAEMTHVGFLDSLDSWR